MLCSETKPGEGCIAQCLPDQQASLSEGCGDVAAVVERSVFPESNQPAIGVPDAMPVETEPAPADEPKVPAADTIIAVLDNEVAAIIKAGKQGYPKDLETCCSTFSPGEGRLALCLVAHAED